MRKIKADGKRDILAILVFLRFLELSDPLNYANRGNLYYFHQFCWCTNWRHLLPVKHNPRGTVIARNSAQSSVTIPFERTFRDLETGRPADNQLAASSQFNFCGCGWPQHMLIPKGNAEGFPCQLFVMVSNYSDDRVRYSF